MRALLPAPCSPCSSIGSRSSRQIDSCTHTPRRYIQLKSRLPGVHSTPRHIQVSSRSHIMGPKWHHGNMVYNMVRHFSVLHIALSAFVWELGRILMWHTTQYLTVFGCLSEFYIRRPINKHSILRLYQPTSISTDHTLISYNCKGIKWDPHQNDLTCL